MEEIVEKQQWENKLQIPLITEADSEHETDQRESLAKLKEIEEEI